MNRMGRESRGTSWLMVTALTLVMLPSLVTASKAPTQPPAPTPSKPQIVQSFGKLPLSFEANTGQMDRQVQFVARGQGYTLFLAQDEAVFVLRKAKAEVEAKGENASRDYEQTVLRMHLGGANPTPRVAGLEKLPGIVNYFIGHDPQKWRTNIPTYQKVEYKNMYSGIDLVYYGNQGKLEYDFVVSPGADPNQIKLAFEGAKDIKLAGSGDLILTTETGEVRLHKPLVYQAGNDGHRTQLAGNYVLQPTLSAPSPSQGEGQGEGALHEVRIALASYDAKRPLVIDPVLAYYTYLGGGSSDRGSDIAVDAAGNAYVTGQTISFDFPTEGALQFASGGGDDAFVTKLNATGSALIYSTYLGGLRSDSGLAIAVDTAGSAYVTGATESLNFPTQGAFQTTFGGGGPFGGTDAFVTKLDATGAALVYSTYLGGGDSDVGSGIAVDAPGSAYVTGGTLSSNFPTTSGAFDLTRGGTSDAFVTKLDTLASGPASLVYSTYLGGLTFDQGSGIAVDAAGNAYVTGTTNSSNFPNVPNDFPTTSGAFQPTFRGGSSDAFVTKLNPAGGGPADLVYSTFLGGRFSDRGSGIAVNATGNAYVTGSLGSDDFPTTSGAFQVTSLGTDAFVTKLNAAGSGPVYSTYLGGSSLDFGQGISVDTAGNAYVTGETSSRSFPKTDDAFQTGFVGFASAFVTKLNPAGGGPADLVYSTFLGESNGEEPVPGIAVDASGNAYVTGLTRSPNFPTTPGAFQTIHGGSSDAFVAKFSFGNTPAGTNVTVQLGQVTVTFPNVTVAGDTTLTTSDTGPPPPAGFKLGSPPTYYDLTTTAEFTGSVRVCIEYSGVSFQNEGDLQLFHFEDTNNDTVADTWKDQTVSLNTTTNIICADVTSLSPFAIFEPAIQAFATFRPEVEIKLRPGATNDTFEVEAFFTLSALSNGINPLTEAMSFKVGSFSTPALSFKQKKGRFKFEGVIGGVRLVATIRPSRRGGFKFEAEGKCTNLDGTVNPVTVELTIGDDRGSAEVTADIESSRKRGKCGERRDDDKDDKNDKGDKHDKDDDDD